MWYVYVLSKTPKLQHYMLDAVKVPTVPASTSGTLFVNFTSTQMEHISGKVMQNQTPPDLYHVLFTLFVPKSVVKYFFLILGASIITS